MVSRPERNVCSLVSERFKCINFCFASYLKISLYSGAGLSFKVPELGYEVKWNEKLKKELK